MKVMPERAVVEDMAGVSFSKAASVVQIGCGGGKNTFKKLMIFVSWLMRGRDPFNGLTYLPGDA
jgi:trans-aconitate methyltransferase